MIRMHNVIILPQQLIPGFWILSLPSSRSISQALLTSVVFNLHLCSIDCGSLKLAGHGGGAIRLHLGHDEERKQMVPFPR